MSGFQQTFPIVLSQTEDGNEVVANVTGTVLGDYDFVVLVDAAVVRSGDPNSTEHFFAAKKYTEGTWPTTGDTYNIAVSPALKNGDTVTAKAYAAYTVTTTTP